MTPPPFRRRSSEGENVKQIRKRLTYANVMSSLAVFLVLGGAAFAAAKLPKNSVGTKQLKNNAVTAAKIKNEAVSGAKIKAGAVDGTKLVDGSVSNGKLADGSVSTGKLADGSVSNGKLANNAVTSGKIADGSVGSGKLADAAVTGSKIANGSATQSKLGADVVAPRAIAHVEINGSEEPFIGSSQGEGVISVAQGTVKGFYCFQLGFTPTAMQITDLIKGHFDFGVGEPGASFLVCPSGVEASVIMVKSENGLADSSPQAFTIAFY
jgi:hypothetical protein